MEKEFREKQLQEIKNVKKILNNSKTKDDIFNSLKVYYEQISNRNDIDFDAKYNIMEIFNSKTIKTIRKKINKSTIVIFEFVNYKKALNELAILYNVFENKIQNQLEIFIKQGDIKL